MFDHVTIRVSDRTASERFYTAALAPLGVEPTHVDEQFAEWADFSLASARAPGDARAARRLRRALARARR